MTKEDFKTRLETSLQDTAEQLPPDDIDRLLSQAVLLYSKTKPCEKIHELTGDGVAYDFVLPTGWVEGFSSIVGLIEYPADDSQSPAYIGSSDWQFFRKLVVTVTTTYLRFTTFIPENGKKVRFPYTIPHVLSDTSNTISDYDIEAVVSLAASLCFWSLAAKFAQTSDSTISADVIDYQRKSDTYSALAKEKLSLYNALMGIGSSEKASLVASAGTVVKEFDVVFPWGEDYLTHPSRER